jgi:hypothetical protein
MRRASPGLEQAGADASATLSSLAVELADAIGEREYVTREPDTARISLPYGISPQLRRQTRPARPDPGRRDDLQELHVHGLELRHFPRDDSQ